VQTADPTGIFEGLVRAGVGNLGKRQIDSMVNVPLNGDELAARLVFRYLQDDGYSKFVRVDNRNAGDVDSNYAGRFKLRWAPADKPFWAVVAADYSEFRSNGQATTTLAMNPNLDLGGGFTTGMAMGLIGFDPTPYLTTNSNFRKNFGYGDTGFGLDVPHDKNNSKGVSATVNVELGEVNLKSITAYRKSVTDNVLDLDGLPINLVSFISSYDQHQFSQEFQLSGTIDKLDWIGGAMYFREASHEFADSRSFSFLNLAAPLGRGTSGDTENTSVGVFGQVNYHLTDKLRATAGYRYTRDRREIVRHPLLDVTTQLCAIPSASRDVPGGACDQSQAVNFGYPSWVLSVDYQLDSDILLYAKTSGAAMAGGWNLRGNFAPSFAPEKVRDVEGGIKADLFDRRLRTNLAVFHTWQDRAQRVVAGFDPQFNSSTQYVINSGDTRLYGVELEATLVPWDGMTVNATYAYLHSQYVSGTFNEDQVIASAGPVPAGCSSAGAGQIVCSVDRSGEPLPYAPKYNWTLAATQEFQTPAGLLSLHVDYAYTAAKHSYSTTAAAQQSQSYKDQVAEANNLGVIDGYGLLNALIKLDVDEHWEASLWGRNLTDKQYLQNVADFYVSFGPALGATAAPRTYGATVAYRW
jgi:iron complex outermembrane receptor protein